MNEEVELRQNLLEVLYQARKKQAGKPNSDGWTPEAEIKNAVWPCAFALSVLQELAHIKRDGFKLRITGQGVIACERGHRED